MLTRLSSICVLEYLSFEKRLYIVSQISGFRKVEKSLPLNLDYLMIAFDIIRIDEHEYYLTNKRSQDAGTIEIRKRQVENPPSDSTVLGLSPFPDAVPKTFENLVCDLIGNRPMIYTKKLEFVHLIGYRTQREMDAMISRLPSGLKIQAEAIEASWFSFNYNVLNRISKFLGPKPLKEFSSLPWGFVNWTHPIIQNSEKLVLRIVGYDPQRISHRHIHLKDYGRRTLIDRMKAWIANGPEIGMEFSGDIKVSDEKNQELSKWEIDEEEKSIKEIMYLRKCESNGRRVKADERFPNTLYSISMPRTNNPNSEIQMSLIKNESNDPHFQIYLKVQPSGTAIPERFDSMYWELKLWEIRKIFNTDENPNFFGIFVMHFIFPSLFVIIFVSTVLEYLNHFTPNLRNYSFNHF